MNPYIKLPEVPIVYGRQDLILSKCKGKRVLHLGCADAGLLRERYVDGDLMHQKLATVATELWGVDIDEEGISFLQSQGFNNLIVGDICKLGEIADLKGKTFDIIVASEVIEHLQNPGLFLEGVKTLMRPGETEFIITVPNAFRVESIIWLFRGTEYIHPDHHYLFSYYTITNLLQKKEFKIEKIYVYSFQPLSILPSLSKLFFKKEGAEEFGFEFGRSSSMESSQRALRKGRLTNYIKQLPRRLLVSMLYKRTPFWGDGMIILARV